VKKLKIYLGDMTYETTTLSTEVFPLNIGFIASYCLKRFGDNVEITLFKYIDELEKAIHESPPDILGMSNYVWCQNISLEMFRIMKKVNPNGLSVWGGPNFPLDMKSQEQFLRKYTEFDIYIPVEGEIGFSNIVEQCLQLEKNEIRNKVLSQPVEGCIIRNPNGQFEYKNSVMRLDELNEIPSPYLTGLMDKFFDGKLSPMLQTNRGCPFMCSYCVDGTDLVKKVNQFSTERSIEEIQYIGKHIPKNTHTLYISDLNFGMYADDIKTCRAIKEIQKKYDYPHFIQASTGKNAKKKIINAIKELNGTLHLLMSVQSMDKQVLKNIRRDNISLEQMMSLIPAIKSVGLRTMSECILGLPGESFNSHIETLRSLIHAEIDNVQVYTCMILPGSELATPEQREKWNLQTKFRILPRDFVRLNNGRTVIETEEVVVSTDDLSFDEYIELRLLAFVLWVTNVPIVYDAIVKLLHEYNIDVFDLFYKIMKTHKESSQGVCESFNQFKQSTINELWESPEELIEHYQNIDEYDKLLHGETGINVIQYHQALVTQKHMEEWTENVIKIAHELILEKNVTDSKLEGKFKDVTNYCRGLSFNILGKNRFETNKEFDFIYNIPKWLKDQSEITLENFKNESKLKIKFQITDKQYKVVNDEFEKYGESLSGVAKALRHLPMHLLWRNPNIIEEEKF
jgi:radical SAM superfamily enzyme YgiQ (UPF0313 family)